MTDEKALIAAVLASPDDDLPRLVYADWLDEAGRCVEAEFVRVQCKLARTPGPVECRGRLLEFRQSGAIFRETPTLRVALAPGTPRPAMGAVCRVTATADAGQSVRAAVVTERMDEHDVYDPRGRVEVLFRAAPEPPEWAAYDALRRREGELRGDVWERLDLPPGWAAVVTDLPWAAGDSPFVVVRRGFADAAECPAEDWLAHADALLAAHPVREVRLTTHITGEHVEHEQTGRHEHRYRVRGRDEWHTEAACSLAAGAIYPGLFRLTWPGVKTWNLPRETGADYAAGPDRHAHYLMPMSMPVAAVRIVPP